MHQRARSTKDKVRRAENLLEAAEALAGELGGARHVTVAAVARRAGLDPSGMRRYFASREELLLELAERGWGRWRDAVRVEADGCQRLSPAGTAQLLSRTISALPMFCDLLAHVPLSLEGDVDLERARRYKTNAFAAYDDIVADLNAVSVLGEREIASLITTALALVAHLWQVSHPTPTLARLYEEVPRWGHAALSFDDNLDQLLVASAVGLDEGVTRPGAG